MSKTIARKAATATVKSAKASSPKRAKATPKAVKAAVVLPEGYKQFNRTSLTAAYRRLSGDAKATKFATRDEGRKALEAIASV